MAFNELSDAQAERLAMLAEEAGEVVLAVGKILRHGYYSSHPDQTTTDRNNKIDLETEIGDFIGIAEQMCKMKDLSQINIIESKNEKWAKALKYTHHQ